MTNLRVENLKMVMPDFILTADAFEVKAGQYLSVEARSGFGKTTLLRGLMGLQTMDKGTILLNGVHLEKTESHTRNFGVVFQDQILFSHLNALDNALFGLKLRGQVNAQMREETRKGFQMLGMENRLQASIHELSGGERQRLAMLRATLFKPSCLILDEPLKGLDSKSAAALMAYLRQFLLSHPVPVIWISHQGEEPLNGVRIIGKEQAGQRHFEFHGR